MHVAYKEKLAEASFCVLNEDVHLESRVGLYVFGHALLFEPLQVVTRRFLVLDELFLGAKANDIGVAVLCDLLPLMC